MHVGIPKVRLTERPDGIHLATHMSTSRDKSVAESFMGKEGGMLVEIRGGYTGRDVSWVSKFPDEHETLFYRGGAGYPVKNVTINGKVQNVVLEGPSFVLHPSARKRCEG